MCATEIILLRGHGPCVGRAAFVAHNHVALAGRSLVPRLMRVAHRARRLRPLAREAIQRRAILGRARGDAATECAQRCHAGAWQKKYCSTMRPSLPFLVLCLAVAIGRAAVTADDAMFGEPTGRCRPPATYYRHIAIDAPIRRDGAMNGTTLRIHAEFGYAADAEPAVHNLTVWLNGTMVPVGSSEYHRFWCIEETPRMVGIVAGILDPRAEFALNLWWGYPRAGFTGCAAFWAGAPDGVVAVSGGGILEQWRATAGGQRKVMAWAVPYDDSAGGWYMVLGSMRCVGACCP